MLRFLLGLFLLFGVFDSSIAFGAKLVPKSTIDRGKSLTEKFTLSNGIPVIYRQIDNSDILQINYNFHYGLVNQEHEEKLLPDALFGTMPSAAKGWEKSKVFRTLEKYSAAVACSSGIETSACKMTTINEYWDELLPLFAAVIKSPSLNKEDVELQKKRTIAEAQRSRQESSRYVNDVVNRVYYPAKHPYRLSLDDKKSQASRLTTEKLRALHNKILNSNLHHIVVVGSIGKGKLQETLEKSFGKIKGKKKSNVVIKQPNFNKQKAISEENREIPTAYLRLKMNMPGVKEQDYIASRIMMKILDDELSEEIRTRRSLSYSVFSFIIGYEIGIGVIGVSTSKPKETLEAIHEVISKVKKQTFSREKIDEFLTLYATEYFLTLEEHSSLASSLSNYFHYFGNTDVLYELPQHLRQVSAADIKRVANKYLVNFRAGIVFDKKKFESKWIESFIGSNLGKRSS